MLIMARDRFHYGFIHVHEWNLHTGHLLYVLVCISYVVAFYKRSVQNACSCVRENYCQEGFRGVV